MFGRGTFSYVPLGFDMAVGLCYVKLGRVELSQGCRVGLSRVMLSLVRLWLSG